MDDCDPYTWLTDISHKEAIMRSRELYFAVMLLVISLSAPAVAQTPLANQIAYEGYITLNSQPVNGQAIFEFKLFNQATGGA